jgi:hypothetical protein
MVCPSTVALYLPLALTATVGGGNRGVTPRNGRAGCAAPSPGNDLDRTLIGNCIDFIRVLSHPRYCTLHCLVVLIVLYTLLLCLSLRFHGLRFVVLSLLILP